MDSCCPSASNKAPSLLCSSAVAVLLLKTASSVLNLMNSLITPASTIIYICAPLNFKVVLKMLVVNSTLQIFALARLFRTGRFAAYTAYIMLTSIVLNFHCGLSTLLFALLIKIAFPPLGYTASL